VINRFSLRLDALVEAGDRRFHVTSDAETPY